jgi:hypothetical protein
MGEFTYFLLTGWMGEEARGRGTSTNATNNDDTNAMPPE